jgi:hypothetical protein
VTSQPKLWILRLASIPALLLLPVACAGVAVTAADQLLGDDFPLGAVMLATAIGIAAIIPLSVWTVFARRSVPLKHGVRVLVGIIAFDFLAFPVSALLCFWAASLTTPTVHERATVRLKSVIPPRVDITGTWQGSWTDPKMKATETITLTVSQTGALVTGTIADERYRDWRIIEGVVSGDELDLFYDLDFPNLRTRGATLRGVIKNNSIKGEYYGHESPARGWASSGTWVASRVHAEPKATNTLAPQ